MAKPTPKPLLRMVEREEYSECLGASVERPFEEAPGLMLGCVLWVSVGLCVFLEVHHSD